MLEIYAVNFQAIVSYDVDFQKKSKSGLTHCDSPTLGCFIPILLTVKVVSVGINKLHYALLRFFLLL